MIQVFLYCCGKLKYNNNAAFLVSANAVRKPETFPLLVEFLHRSDDSAVIAFKGQNFEITRCRVSLVLHGIYNQVVFNFFEGVQSPLFEMRCK